jgi:hypothetical protein
VTFVGIPFKNRPDLLERAKACVPTDLLRVLETDNSGENQFPFSYSQSMAFLQDLACRYPYWFFMHSDGVAQREDFERLIALADGMIAQGRKWAVIFTLHDVLACINTSALASIGGWDTTFPDYFSDNHNYRRLRLAGYEMIQLENHTVEHGVDGKGSQTINSDPVLRRTNEILFPAYAQLYREIWGGSPGEEKFNTPWNK